MVISKSLNKNSIFSKIAIIILLIFPILRTYGISHYNYAFIAMTALAVISLLKYGIKNCMPQWLYYYFIFWTFSHMITATSITSAIPVGAIRTYLVFNMLFRTFDKNYCLKIYDFLGIACLSFFFFQEFLYYTKGVRIPGIIQGLPLALDVDSAESYFANIVIADRSSSFFSEPAHFVQFLLPLFAIKLFKPSKKYDILFAVAILIALLMLQSGNALIGLAVIGVSFVFGKILKTINFKKIVLLVFISFFGVIVASYYIKSTAGQELLERQEELDSSGNSSALSGFMRIYRGYYVYEALHPINMIIGADNEDRIKEAIYSSTVAWSFRKNDFYFNVVQSLLIRTGIIGTIIFIVFLFISYRKIDVCGKSILLVFVSLCFVSALYFTEVMALYLLLALSYPYDKGRIQEKLIKYE